MAGTEQAPGFPQRESMRGVRNLDYAEQIAVAIEKPIPLMRKVLIDHLRWLHTRIEYHRSIGSQMGQQRAAAFDAAFQELITAVIDDD